MDKVTPIEFMQSAITIILVQLNLNNNHYYVSVQEFL